MGFSSASPGPQIGLSENAEFVNAASPPPNEPGTTLIDRLVDRAVRALTDSTRNNPLLYYRQSTSTRFNLPDLGSDFIAKFLAHGDLREADFAPISDALAAAQTNVIKTTPLQSRLLKMRAKARENEEERGLQTLFAAIGMVTWPASDGGRPPLAPLFLVPAQIDEDTSTRGNFVVRRVEDGEVVFNRAIFALAPKAFQDVIGDLFEGGVIDDVPASYQRVIDAAAQTDGTVKLLPASALGIFNYSMMAVVTDLDEARDKLSEHIVIRALAGDPEAQATLSRDRDGAVALAEIDTINPPDEPFVLDADPWQSSTIQTLRRFDNSHATIDGPPGTGKSQTIANLIASFIAQGKSVLFCCEKRAALDVVKRRLAGAGLGHLVLDLHGAGVTRQRAYAQLRGARLAISQTPPATTEFDPIVKRARASLIAHDAFMHGAIANGKRTPFMLMSELAGLPTFDIHLRLDAAATAKLDARLETLESDLSEAARCSRVFLHDPNVPWASARKLDSASVPQALDLVQKCSSSLDQISALLENVKAQVETRAEMQTAIVAIQNARTHLAICAPGICQVDAATAALAADTLQSPFGGLLQLVSSSRKAAVLAVKPHLGTATGKTAADAIRALIALDEPWRNQATAIAALPSESDTLLARVSSELDTAEGALGRTSPEARTEMSTWIRTCAGDRDGAYRAARMNEIEKHLADSGLEPLLATFATLDPELWGKAVRYTFLQSLLEPLRPALARFDGRTQDGIVAKFADVEGKLRRVAGDRVRRAAAEHFIAVTHEFRDQNTALNVQLERVRSKKPLRKMFEDVPDVMLGLAPCVMASPLTVSQFLPRKSCFDVVIFDEGSQMTPESAITAILRGKRVVIAGDDRQLPPTSFFATAVDEDDVDEDETDATAGTESILAALRPFTKPLGLRVHYRSRDERLIAFSNHYLYDDSLITFPGAGEDARGLAFVLVDPSGSEADENSSSPEVIAVVDLIIEHAETQPDFSLGVIALGSTHAARIEAHLADVRRTRPDLDTFFDDTKPDPFFVKNLERVQGDERDAIILTIGYGRTKTGSVSHNFGPINQTGGERRLNVAITRAKMGLTLVASFRKADLNLSSLNSTGAKLLAAYLGYAESSGRDLGRDGADLSVPPSDIERDVQRALEQRLGTTLIPQYGVGKFRIDLAVQHPQQPGRFVLAVEFDGATYHSSPTARLRDRQRQQILEGQGWTFCRIWSTDWFNNRESELARVELMYQKALAAPHPSLSLPAAGLPNTHPTNDAPQKPKRIGNCPIGAVRSVQDLSDGQLRVLLDWISSDGCLRTDDELFSEMQVALHFARRGTRIVERFDAAIASYKSTRS